MMHQIMPQQFTRNHDTTQSVNDHEEHNKTYLREWLTCALAYAISLRNLSHTNHICTVSTLKSPSNKQ